MTQLHAKARQAVLVGALPFALSIINLDAEASGGELELTLTPSDRLTVGSGLSAMSSKVPMVRLPSVRLIESELPCAPSPAANGVIRYERVRRTR